jgi:aldose 1-epimerase
MTEVVTTHEGSVVQRWVLDNGTLRVEIITLGGIITALHAPDVRGARADVVLGFDTPEGYLGEHPYFGALIGRVAGRLGGASFALDGRVYGLVANDGPNALHGGPRGLHRAVWAARSAPGSDGPALELTHRSPAGEGGYPGNLDLRVVYELRGDTLRLDYHATTDAPTLVNLTSHPYFNLAGAESGSVLAHRVEIEAEAYTPVGPSLLPTGEIAPVRDTPLDFTSPHAIGERIAALDSTGGYDHNFVLRRAGVLSRAARVTDPASGRVLEVSTTEPGLQFYSGNQLDGSIVGKRGTAYRRHQGFCLEAQHFPDAPHHPGFPSIVLRPGDEYKQTTEYHFSIEGASHRSGRGDPAGGGA